MVDSEYFNLVNIIGEESQTMNIILKKNEKIFINKQYIIYASSEDLDEIIYKNVDSLIKPNTVVQNSVSNDSVVLKKVDNPMIIRLKNKNDNIEYIGLSRGNRIMKIYPILYQNLYVRLDSILAFSNDIELLQDNEKIQQIKILFQGRLFQMNNVKDFMIGAMNRFQFCLVKPRFNSKNFSNNSNENIPNSFENIPLLEITSYINDFIYISGKRNLIEKRLGKYETISLMLNSIVLFESSITFSSLKKEGKNITKYVNPFNDILVEGPGLIIFEPAKRDLSVVNPRISRRLVGMTILLLVIEIITQLYIHNNIRN